METLSRRGFFLDEPEGSRRSNSFRTQRLFGLNPQERFREGLTSFWNRWIDGKQFPDILKILPGLRSFLEPLLKGRPSGKRLNYLNGSDSMMVTESDSGKIPGCSCPLGSCPGKSDLIGSNSVMER
jgi:hypothetical protein